MTDQELRSNLQTFDLPKLWEYCDALELEHPATKEATINLLIARCPSCMQDKLTRSAKFVVKYLNINVVLQSANVKGSVVTQKQGCKTCPK